MSIDVDDFDTKTQGDIINEIIEKIIRDRNYTIDLFCKTFLIAQEPKSLEELKALFQIADLECTMGKDFTQTFRIKLRET